MFEPNKNSTSSMSGDGATDLKQPEMELVTLYKRLAKTQKGSEDYKQILQEIEGAKDRMDAHRQLFSALMDAVDRERLSEIAESTMVVEKRIHTQMNELFGKDLTLTEMLRVSRLINTQIEQSDRGVRHPRRDQQQARNRRSKFE